MRTFKILTAVIAVFSVVMAFWLNQIYFKMQSQLKKESALPSIEIYSNSFKIKKNKIWVHKDYTEELASRGYKHAKYQTNQLFEKNFSIHLIDENFRNESTPIQATHYAEIRHSNKDSHLVFLNKNFLILKVLHVQKNKQSQWVPQLELPPLKFAQIFQGKPIKKTLISLEQVPLYCLQAITAIEDNRFLSHRGIHLQSIFRATLKNILSLRYAQGGSTITQQLVKNFFLKPEKTLQRKLKEIFMATMLELQLNKDRILELYLNVIYMGQNKTFQIRGFGEASQHYFLKDLSQLNLSQCALMASIVNSPGRFNPFTQSKKALKRRNRVLSKMREFQMIDDESYKNALAEPLPTRMSNPIDPSPYFVQAVMQELRKKNIRYHNGLKVYTTLSPTNQTHAKNAVTDTINQLENFYLSLKEKKESGHPLQAALLSIDLQTGGALALIGGRDFKQTQFSRVTQAHRQVGSVMKPIVYLSALNSKNENGDFYSPLSVLLDEKFSYEYDKQVWAPKNYKGTFEGPVLLYYALKNSINIPSAQLGIQIGLENIVTLSKKLGIRSPIQAVPAISLGVFELYLWEVAQAYTTIANFGIKKELHFIKQINDLNDNEIKRFENQNTPVVSKESAAVLVSMMKQTTLSGTAKSLAGTFKHAIASKTGTTSDHKDAWFVGFTPKVLTVVWLGYDDNLSHGLSGATGALPIWKKFMKKQLKHYPPQDFEWPKTLKKITLSVDELQKAMPEVSPKNLNPTELYIRN